MRITLAFIAILYFQFSFGQQFIIVSKEEALSDLSRLSKVYSSVNYQLNYDKQIFENKTDVSPILTTSGSIYKGEKHEYRMAEKGTLLIQNNSHKIVVDTALSVVTIDKVDTSFSSISIDQLVNSGQVDQFVFKRKEDKSYLMYQFESSDKSQGITELWIDKKDFTLYRLSLSFPPANYFNEDLEDETLETPILIIFYMKPIALKEKKSLFSTSEWVVKDLNSTNDDFLINPLQIGFNLHDLRYKKTN